MKKNQFVRMCLEILAGIGISVVLSIILIFFGYFKANSGDLDSYSVNIFGLTLYNITKISGEYTGQAINQNMSIIGILCSILIMMINETRIFIKNNKKNNN